MAVLALAIFNSLAIPFEQAFNPEFIHSTAYARINDCVDFIFVLDVILMFFTSVINKNGKESYIQSEISEKYMSQNRFKVDIISILGSGVFQSLWKYASLFGLFKMMRVFRIGGMISESTVDEGTKALLNLFKICFYLYFYLHLVACYFWIAIGYNSAQRYTSWPDKD